MRRIILTTSSMATFMGFEREGPPPWAEGNELSFIVALRSDGTMDSGSITQWFEHPRAEEHGTAASDEPGVPVVFRVINMYADNFQVLFERERRDSLEIEDFCEETIGKGQHGRACLITDARVLRQSLSSAGHGRALGLLERLSHAFREDEDARPAPLDAGPMDQDNRP